MSMSIHSQLLVRPGRKFRLRDYDPNNTLGHKKNEKTQAKLVKLLRRLDDLQYLLYASKQYALLIILQGVDSAGKDSTIRHVMSGVDPQGCRVVSFKQPTPEEAAHDFLWRIHTAVPNRGEIGIFNRSHYEDVLVVRVHKMVPRSVWSERYMEINHFEKLLADNNVRILKFFLHISRDEQLRRFEDRLHDKTKQWKLSPTDFPERKFWSQYMNAYEDMLRLCSTRWAPWYVIPANHKWFRNLAVSHIIVKTLEDLNLKFPKPAFDVSKIQLK